ncbi:hypothetical protein IUJ34_27250 (plasmid) [Klebsiella pneumoniae subsp. pneumoniae]|uniref:Uncharacterized protein n=1 Tax=Klebsiella pneumoniae subsp. pneumoniae TaxID=72407 RepID=A0A7S9HFQ1_KLEPN|nr:hypothetical protein IUJ34_27250 [Klebsiella pneumoniae subsp. pneumoniae]
MMKPPLPNASTRQKEPKNGKRKISTGNGVKRKIGSNDEIQKVSHWIDSGFPPLNKAISGRYDGGFPSGRIVEIFGPPSAGKTFRRRPPWSPLRNRRVWLYSSTTKTALMLVWRWQTA